MTPLQTLQHHVTGAIERGEKSAIVERRAPSLYFIEVTDTFGGDANYCWVTRHIIKGSTLRGAVNRFSRLSGMSWRAVGCDRYDSKSGATCFFIESYDAENHSEYSLNTDDRS